MDGEADEISCTLPHHDATSTRINDRSTGRCSVRNHSRADYQVVNANAMSKLLLFGLLVFVVYLILRGKGGPKGGRDPGRRPAENMVVCAHCGVHLPKGESLPSDELHYCCEEHRGLGPPKRNA